MTLASTGGRLNARAAPMGVDRPARTERPAESASKRPTSPAARVRPNEQPTDVPSSRPTSVPELDMILATAVSFRRDEGASCFLPDLTVPVPTGTSPAAASLRTAFVFGHADGVSSIVQIAESSGLPLADVVACFLELLQLGAIDFGEASPPSMSASGVFRRVIEEDVSTASSFRHGGQRGSGT